MSGESLTMTIPEFARACSISRGLAYDLARRDKLPVPIIRLGRRMVLSRKAVLALLGVESNGSKTEDKHTCLHSHNNTQLLPFRVKVEASSLTHGEKP